MKNIFIYYLVIILPIPLLIWLAESDNTGWFAIGTLIYALPYRTLIDGMRLTGKNLMRWNEIWKLLIPGKRLDYTQALYFKK